MHVNVDTYSTIILNLVRFHQNVFCRGDCAFGKSVRIACRRLGVRIPVATDLSRKNRQGQLHRQTLGIRCECQWSSYMTIKNGFPVLHQVWHAKEPSLLNGHESRAQGKICSLSWVMSTALYERKILGWNETNKTKLLLMQMRKSETIPISFWKCQLAAYKGNVFKTFVLKSLLGLHF